MSRILLITLLTTLLGHANEMPMSVRTLAVEGGDMPAWYVASGDKKFELLTWPTNQPSTAIIAKTDGDLLLYTKELNQNGAPEFKMVKKVVIPEAAEELLLLGWPIKNNEQAGLLAIADNLKKAKFNDWLVINHSDRVVTLRFGKENDPIRLNSNEAKTYQIVGEHDKGSEVIAETMMKDEMRKIYSTFWSAQSKQRSIVLFYDKGEAVKLLRIVDYLNEDKDSKP